MKKYVGVIAGISLVPLAASAQGGFQNVSASLDTIGGLISKLIPLIIGAAVLVFLFGILKFVVSGDEEARKNARSYMVFGVIALFVMVSVWGLVNFLRNTFGFSGGSNNPPPPPGVPFR